MSEVSVLNGQGKVALLEIMPASDCDAAICKAARVSYLSNSNRQPTPEDDARLIDYLWRNQHTSPFEMVEFKFAVKAPIFVIRQWHRHRTWSYNEVSGRYSELPEDYYIPTSFRAQSTTNKQGSSLTPMGTQAHQEAMLYDYERVCEEAFHLYHDLLDEGVSREMARMVLPVSTFTSMVAKVNLLNLLKFVRLRSDPHAQLEIQEYSNAMLKLIEPHVPLTIDAFRRHTLGESK